MEKIFVEVKKRDKSGKGVARKLRAQKLIPGVIYGGNDEPIPIQMDQHDAINIIKTTKKKVVFVEMSVRNNGGKRNELVVLRDYQVEPIKYDLLDVEFMRVDREKPLEVECPLIIEGTPEGVKKGGVLQVLREHLTVFGKIDQIPEAIHYDVSNLDIGDVVHIADIEAPEGVELVYETNFPVINILAPETEEPETEETEEPETQEEKTKEKKEN